MIHGKYSTYTNHKCRCGECKGAAAEARRKAKRKDKTWLPHGRVGTYNTYGCRCVACKEAWSEYMKELRGKEKK